MSLSFLLPAALSALAALLLPALIHLARRSEQRPTVFAALRWLRARPRPQHRIRFDEWPLLLVRLLLVACVSSLLAQPVLQGGEDLRPRVAVLPGIDVAAVRSTVRGADEARWLWLAPGFPPVDTRPAAAGAPTSLLRELDAALPAGVALTVVVPAVLDGADAERPRLSRRVDWRVVPVRPSVAVTPPRPTAPPIAIRHDDTRRDDARYLRAAARALRPAATPDIAPPDAALPSGGVLAWLVPGPVPERVRAWTRAGGVLLLDAAALLDDAPVAAALRRDPRGEAVVEGSAYGRGRVLRLANRLQPDAMPMLLDGTFAHALRETVEPHPAPPARVDAAAFAPRTGAASFPVQPRALDGLLALLAALLFAVERWLATGRRAREGV